MTAFMAYWRARRAATIAHQSGTQGAHHLFSPPAGAASLGYCSYEDSAQRRTDAEDRHYACLEAEDGHDGPN